MKLQIFTITQNDKITIQRDTHLAYFKHIIAAGNLNYDLNMQRISVIQ